MRGKAHINKLKGINNYEKLIPKGRFTGKYRYRGTIKRKALGKKKEWQWPKKRVTDKSNDREKLRYESVL